MRQKIIEWKHRWLPLPIDEDLSFKNDTFLEWLFYIIIYYIRKIAHKEKPRINETFFDRIFNLGIIFILLFFITAIFLAIPLFVSDNGPAKFKFIFQMTLIILLGSIAWTGYVIICQEYKCLFKTKILQEINPKRKKDFEAIFSIYFNGIHLVWCDKYHFRIYRRDFFIGIFVIIVGFFYTGLINQINQNLSPILFEAIVQTIIILVPFCMLLFAVFIVFSIVATITLIECLLLAFVVITPLEIHPYIDLGGTAPYGTVIVHGLYISGLAISLLPLLVLSNQIDFNIMITSYNSFQNIENQSMETVFNFTKNIAENSFHDITIASFIKYSQWLILFIIIVIFALAIIFIIRYRIRQQKKLEISYLENILYSTNLRGFENFVDYEKNQYLLLLYNQVQNLHEWPVKKIFLLEVLFSFALLLIPLLF